MRTHTVEWEDEDGHLVETEIPQEWEICPSCSGEGTTIARSLKGIAFSEEDLAEDPEFAHNMANGAYNESCPECNGTGKILVPIAYEQLNNEQKKAMDWLEEQARISAEIDAISAMECRYGA